MTPRQFAAEWRRRGGLVSDVDRASVRAVWVNVAAMLLGGLVGATIGTFVATFPGLLILYGSILVPGYRLFCIGRAVLIEQGWIK